MPKYIEVDELLKSFFIEKTKDTEEEEIREDNKDNNNQMYITLIHWLIYMN